MDAKQQGPHRFAIELETHKNCDHDLGIRQLRQLLKYAGRVCGFRCLIAKPLTAAQDAPQRAQEASGDN